jgi:hypothetical protein
VEVGAPSTGAIPVIQVPVEDDIFALPEEGTTFVHLPRLGVGLGTMHMVFADGSYTADWIPALQGGVR